MGTHPVVAGIAARRLFRVGLQGLARPLLSARAHAETVVRVLRPALRHGRDQQQLLPAADASRPMEGWRRAGAAGLHLRVEARPVRFAPQEAQGRRQRLARQPPRPRPATRAPPRPEPRPAAAALEAQRRTPRRVPHRGPERHPLGRRNARRRAGCTTTCSPCSNARRRAVHPRPDRRPSVDPHDRLDLRALPRPARPRRSAYHGRYGPIRSGPRWPSASVAWLDEGIDVYALLQQRLARQRDPRRDLAARAPASNRRPPHERRPAVESTSPSATSPRPPSRRARRSGRRAAIVSSCSATAPATCTTTCASRWTACSQAGPCRKARRWTRRPSASPCTSRITRSSTSTSKA